ncbi:general secretion pathway protein GspK [Alteromonas sediminis]|uniref:Type II secretion system protein K n=1 Tax=Alteromonas sediminis TaxID=2259342 RepID=A0A3N5Y0P7_9ALTE|nr:type II secretion system minor pseudopilin GspK [Alteromonas sediminis]RPJ66690.1 general secretion pathway protein GspK [Alteromonas sediminis]
MRTQQRGVALVIVLLIVAIVVILATEMTGRLQLNVKRAQNIKDNNQAQWYANSAEAFARKSIKDLMQTESAKIHLAQPWSDEFAFPLENGGIKAKLVDMYSCFNLNALKKTSTEAQSQQRVTPVMEAFHRMLLAVELEQPIESFTADTVRDSLADWLDDDELQRSFGAEDSEYSSRPFPYLAANGLMASQSEFRVIHGVSAQWVNALWPLICVIPGSEELKINVNTLTPELAPVLAGVLGVTLQQANDLINTRPQDGWDDIASFMAEPIVQAAQVTEVQQEWLTVTTQYFILHSKTRYNNASYALSSLFYVPSPASVTVIRREIGGVE